MPKPSGPKGKSKNTIAITLSFAQAFGYGKSESMSSALARPMKQLFEKGKPIGRFNYVFYKDDVCSILGSLCYTPGGRVLFFPGLISRKLIWSKHKGPYPIMEATSNEFVDHITLEKNFRNVHVTTFTNGAKKHVIGGTSRKVRKDVVFWFGLSIQNSEVLEKTPNELTMIFTTPSTDADRCIKLLEEARNNAIFHVTNLPKGEDLKENEFLHFAFFIGPHEYEAIKNLPLFVPTQEPIVLDYVVKEKVAVRKHPVGLEGLMDRKVWVIVSKHFGTIRESDAIITLH